MKHIVSFSGGKDSTAMLLRMVEENMQIDEIVFFDTGWEFPAMADHVAQVEKYIGRKITTLHPRRAFDYRMNERPIIGRKEGPNKGKVYRIGNGWPSPSRRWCTREKVDCIDKHCGQGIRYIGFATEEAHRCKTASLMSKKYERKYPLIEWEMSEPDCLEYCYSRGFNWGGLYNHFRRVSCFCCPLQRIGELRTLRREFPELWTRMIGMEDKWKEKDRGFRGYDTVGDLDNRFAREDAQRERGMSEDNIRADFLSWNKRRKSKQIDWIDEINPAGRHAVPGTQQKGNVA
jgi:3'-phosphoadenosine 5'-phosphosulfate sulfotransferase (PAPS reductase)/FAD synthetase